MSQTSVKWSKVKWAVLSMGIVLGAAAEGWSQEPALRESIDEWIQRKWTEEKIEPAPRCSDATFLRRVYLDLCGTIPTAEEVREFLADSSPDKRSEWIDRLLDDPRYAAHQAEVWDAIYFGRNPPGYGTDKRAGFLHWLTERFAENTPYDQIANAMLKAEGNSVEQGPPLFLVQYRNQPEDATEKITQTFLGVQLQCARCHDHPFESWSQRDFHGMAAFLARLEVVDMGSIDGQKAFAIGEKNLGELDFTGPATEAEPGQKGEPIAPRFLQGDQLEEPALPEDFEEPRRFPNNKLPPAPRFSRKDALANWIASPENTYFAKALANRLWGQFMGRGLVHPVDNLSESNPASHPELLDELTTRMIEQEFDVKWFIRELVNTEAYQLASTGAVTDERPQWFQRGRVRPLTAEELVDAWRVATGYDATDPKVTEQREKGNRFYPLTRGYHLAAFGTPTDGVGNFLGGLHEQLYMSNGGIAKLLTNQKGGLLHRLSDLESDESGNDRVELLYLSSLGRYPTDAERQHFIQWFEAEEASGRPADLLEDALWALLTSSEFRFNH